MLTQQRVEDTGDEGGEQEIVTVVEAGDADKQAAVTEEIAMDVNVRTLSSVPLLHIIRQESEGGELVDVVGVGEGAAVVRTAAAVDAEGEKMV